MYLLVAVVLVFLFVLWKRRGTVLNAPLASGWIPLLGNALAYKADPVAYLRAQHAQHGGIFVMDLAGFSTVLVAGFSSLKQFAAAPESVLSAREAVADFGFRETLGDMNVFVGTDVHKMALKNAIYPALRTKSAQEKIWMIIQRSVQRECTDQSHIDVFPVMRRIYIRVMLDYLVGEPVLQHFSDHGTDFIAEFSRFQDSVEEATAKAVAMPDWLAKYLVLGPVKRQRAKLSAKLTHALKQCAAATDAVGQQGVWLAEVTQGGTKSFSCSDQAELIIGLLFAAHKNPAIGTAQCLAMLLEHPADLALVAAEVRAADWIQIPNRAEGGKCKCTSRLTASLYEALRLSAHTIGAIRKVEATRGFNMSLKGANVNFPVGTFIAASHILPHLDPAVYPTPDSFQPSRFLDQDLASDPLKFTTFSHGIHLCPGRHFALVTMRLVLAAILRRYDVSLTGDNTTLPPICFERATLAQRKGAVLVELQQRR
jgi:cytochrome P450